MILHKRFVSHVFLSILLKNGTYNGTEINIENCNLHQFFLGNIVRVAQKLRAGSLKSDCLSFHPGNATY